MKKYKLFNIAASLLLCMVAFSCSKSDSADIESLLSTVPSDVSAVTVIDLRSVLEKAGCKIDGDKVVPGKEILSAVSTTRDKRIRSAANFLFGGESGIDPSVAAIFIDSFNTYLCGFVADTEKFKALAEKEYLEKFTAAENIEKCGNIAMQGNRFWMCVSSTNTIQTDAVRHFTSLSENQSFLSSKGAERLKKLDHDLELWADIKALLNSTDADFNTKAMANVAIEGMFADASQIEGKLDFLKGKMEISLDVVNSKGDKAKFLYPVAKIDPDVVKAVGASGNAVFAAAISPKMIEKLKEETSGKGTSMLGIYAMALSCVDGTCAVSISNEGNLKGIISTTGNGTSTLSEMLSMLSIKTENKGKQLLISNGTPSGKIDPAQAAPGMKGAMFGVTLSPYANPGKGSFNPDKLKDVTILLVPKDKSVSLEIVAKANDDKENFILSLL